jgi:hypothetical protein
VKSSRSESVAATCGGTAASAGPRDDPVPAGGGPGRFGPGQSVGRSGRGSRPRRRLRLRVTPARRYPPRVALGSLRHLRIAPPTRRAARSTPPRPPMPMSRVRNLPCGGNSDAESPVARRPSASSRTRTPPTPGPPMPRVRTLPGSGREAPSCSALPGRFPIRTIPNQLEHNLRVRYQEPGQAHCAAARIKGSADTSFGPRIRPSCTGTSGIPRNVYMHGIYLSYACLTLSCDNVCWI